MHNRKTAAPRRSHAARRALPLLAVALALCCAVPSPARAQFWFHPKMRTADDLIHKQEPARTTPRVLDMMTQDNSHVVVSISRQRAYLMLGDQIGIDTPISSGKAGHETPTGSFTIQEKDPDHRSSVYGAFCDNNRRIVRAGVSLEIDSAPSGTHFIGAPMLWFCRFNNAIGMHVGILPGYPASHGCVRLPADIAPLIYNKVKVGTPVDVQP
jgi:lipoprotein-anchoring transpeptidase ErfK/SrfK